jgi:hypothetical protein
MLGKHPATAAMADSLDRVLKRSGKAGGSFAIALQEVEGNSLCRLATNTRHASQGIDHSNEER